MNENVKKLGNTKCIRDKYQVDIDILKSKNVKT